MNANRVAAVRRRIVSIPVMLGATATAVVALPVALPLLAIADLVRMRGQLPSVRVALFGLQYALNDSAEILAAPWLWLTAGFGTRLQSTASIARHERIQWWSVRLLARRAEQLLGLRIELDRADEIALTPGPVIVLSRHASLFDASLPGLLYESRAFRVRAVIMSELLADPGFDLIYGRLGSTFVERSSEGAAAGSLGAISEMAQDGDDNTAFVIFPEGRLFRESVLARQLERLAAADPQRHERLQGLTRVLPPRPGGVLALLEAAPDADVIVLDHQGLDRFSKLADLVAHVPVDEPVRVTARRIPRREIPTTALEQTAWLDELWLDLDLTQRTNR